jgi:hypothetical protein
MSSELEARSTTGPALAESRPEPAAPRRNFSRIGLIIATLGLVLSLGARLIYLDAGPFGGDERYVVLHALKFGTGNLNPKHFDWPASSFYYLTFLVDGFFFAGGFLAGWFRSPTDFVLEYLSNPRAYYLIPRLLSASFGLGTVVLLIRATGRMVDRPTGRLAGLLLLMVPLHVQISRVGLADVPMTFFAIASLGISLRIATSAEARRRDYLLAGIMVGLAGSMKYHGVLSASYVISADLYREFPRLGWRAVVGLPVRRSLLAAAGMSILAFVATTPFAVLDYPTFFADLWFQLAHQRGIVEHIGIVEPPSPILELFRSTLPEVVGLPIVLLGFAGGVLALVDRRLGLAGSMLIPSVVLGLAAFLMSRVRFTYYLLPITPCLCALAAITIRSIAGRLASTEPRRSLISGLALGLILALTIPFQVKTALALGLPHTGSATMAWVLEHFKPGTKFAMDDEEDLNFLPTVASLDRSIAEAKAAGFSGRVDYYSNLRKMIERDRNHPHYDLYRLHASDRSGDYLRYLQDQDVRYFIRSGSVVSMFRRNRPSPTTEERLRFYKELESRAKLIATIEGDNQKLRGRSFEVFELPAGDR